MFQYVILSCAFDLMLSPIFSSGFKFIALVLCTDPAASADLAVVLMQEGLAQIFLVGRRYWLQWQGPLSVKFIIS